MSHSVKKPLNYSFAAILNSSEKNDTVKSRNIKSICNQINDCDIDKIAERLIKKGKDKPFPNISSN